MPFECPVCKSTIDRNAPPPPPPRPGRRSHIKYDFGVLEVGDSITIEMPQNNVASRIAAWRNAKGHAKERADRLFTTRRVGATTTTVWRTH